MPASLSRVVRRAGRLSAERLFILGFVLLLLGFALLLFLAPGSVGRGGR